MFTSVWASSGSGVLPRARPQPSGPAVSAPLPVPLKGPSVLLAGRPSVYGMSQLLVLVCVCVCSNEMLSVV